MKKRQIIILSVFGSIILLIVFALSSRSGGVENKKQEQQNNTTYVKTDKAHVSDHDLTIKGNGRIGSSRNVVLIAEVQGKLLPGNTELKSGASFNKGAFLFGIDDTEMRLRLQSRKSGFLTMLATSLPDLKIDFPEEFKRWEAFFESIDVKETLPELPEIKSVKGKTYLASKNILGEYYSIKADEKTLSNYKIYAPFAGNFIDVFTELGTVVNPGSQIARIIQTGSMEVEVPLSVSEVHYLSIGQKVDVYVEGEDDAVPGKILRIGEYINPNTQSVDVFVGIDRSSGVRIYDGMYVDVIINAGVIQNVVKVPRRAMVDDKHMFIVRDSFLIRQPVKTELKSENFSFISGLKEGDEMVVEALTNPVDSMIVETLPVYEEGR